MQQQPRGRGGQQLLLAGQDGVLLSGPRLWAAVAGLSVDQLVAWGILYYAHTVLSAPIATDLGVSRLHVAAAFSMCLLIAGWVARHVGPILDARGTRGVLRAGAIAGPVVFAGLAAVGGMASLVFAFALLGVVQALALYEPAFRTVVDWCPEERSRSRALLVVTIVGGFASTMFLPLTGWLLTFCSWRQTVLVLAGILTLVLGPIRFSLPLPNQGHARIAPHHLATPPSATRLAAGLSMHSLASTGVFLTMMWHLFERGESLGAAAAIAGFAGAAQVPGRIASAPLRRLVGGAAFLPLLLAIQAVALLVIAVVDGSASTVCVFLFGAASGMVTLERATVLVEWYGRATFGGHQGRLAAATSTARALSPFVVEAGHHVASYASVFVILGGVLALGAWICRSAARIRALEPA